METRIIKAVFGASKSIVAPKRFKNDWGQVLELVGITLPQTFTAHFANSKTGTAKKRIGQNNQVDVPDEFFTSGADIFCWVMVHDTVSDGRTMYTVRIPIEDRGTATDEEPTPVQQDVIEQAIAALNSAVEQTAQDVESADASAQSAKADADRAETAMDTAEEYVSTVQNYAQQAQASATNASSSATASANSASQAQQIKTDVEGMVDEAQSAAGASAQSALASAQSASQASASATSASQSAETANTKASEASASAQTASTKAAEASGYASTASAKASEASQSASAASGYATQAEQAKTDSQTAQGLAESARDSAISAKNDAEQAKADAETARDEAQQAVASISGALDDKAPVITDTASGSIASFSDGADDLPLKSLVVDINPVQDLHGQDAPYPAGSTSNKLDLSSCTFSRCSLISIYDGSVKLNIQNGYFAAVGYTGNTIPEELRTRILNGEPITFEANNNNGYSISLVVYGTRSNGGTYQEANGYNNIVTLTPSLFTNVTSIEFRFHRTGQTHTDTTTVITGLRVSYGDTATSYHPYENICPISGWTEVNVNHSGADMTNPTTLTIQFGQTVYGGKLDVLSGELTVDGANIASYNGETLPSTWISDRDVYASGTTPTTGAQVVYELAEPITYQLTPQEIRSLLGTNNIWADTGDSTVEYRADTKLYISKKIAEAVNALA